MAIKQQISGARAMTSAKVTEHDDTYTVVQLRCRGFDLNTAMDVADAFRQALDMPGLALIIDMAEVEFMDSTGLGLVVGARKRQLRRGGSVHVVCTTRKVRAVFAITGLDKVFHLYDTLDQAVEELVRCA